LVEAYGDSGINGDQFLPIFGREPDYLRRLRGKSPGVVFSHYVADAVSQPRLNDYAVGHAASQRTVGREHIHRRIQPLALALDLRVECQRLRQVGLLHQCGERHNRPVEHHSDRASDLYFGRAGSRNHLGHLQIAHRAEAEDISILQANTVPISSFGCYSDCILDIPLQKLLRHKRDSLLVGPLETASDRR